MRILHLILALGTILLHGCTPDSTTEIPEYLEDDVDKQFYDEEVDDPFWWENHEHA